LEEGEDSEEGVVEAITIALNFDLLIAAFFDAKEAGESLERGRVSNEEGSAEDEEEEEEEEEENEKEDESDVDELLNAEELSVASVSLILPWSSPVPVRFAQMKIDRSFKK
jgi:hypothetical protein